MELAGDIVETTVCRLCNDIAEDAIESKCHHVFDRECIKQYLEASVGTTVRPFSLDLLTTANEITFSPNVQFATYLFLLTSKPRPSRFRKIKSTRRSKVFSGDWILTSGGLHPRLRP
jgi:hypothetical protein